MDRRISFLGVGNMGKGITQNLVSKGKLQKPLLLWNRTHETAVQHQQLLGSSVCLAVSDFSSAISQGDIVWSCLSNEVAVLEVYSSALKQDIRDKIFIDSSTITPHTTDLICGQVKAAVFGEPTMAATGTLTCIPSGKAETIDLIRPLLVGVIARNIIELGGQAAGKASLLKLIGNTFILNTMQMVAEGHVFAEKSGLGCDQLHAMIEALFPVGPAKVYSSRMISGGYFKDKPMVHLSDARKLASQVSQVASNSATDLRAYGIAIDRLERATQLGGSEGDISSIYGAVRAENGLEFQNS